MGAGGAAAQRLALALAAAGADVALTSATPDADEAFALRRLARKIEALGRRSLVESVDMANGASVQVAVRQVAKALGGIDVLVLAAEFHLPRPAERLTDAEWARVINQNLSAVFFACRGAAREMLRQSPAPTAAAGRIVVLLPAPATQAQEAAFAAARAGVAALVAALAREWASIAVNAIALPAVPDEAALARAEALALQLVSAPEPGSGQVIAV